MGRRADIREVDDDLLAAGVRRIGPYKRVDVPVACVCLTCGQEVTPRLENIRRGRSGCASCAAKRRYHRQPPPRGHRGRIRPA